MKSVSFLILLLLLSACGRAANQRTGASAMNDSKRVCTMIYAPAECSAFGITLEGGNECDARGRMEDELLAQGHNASDFSAITCKSLPL